MIRGLLLAAVLFLTPLPSHSAEAEKVQFKQTGSAPRDLPDAATTAPVAAATPAQESAALLNFQETLKKWRSAKKRLQALQSAGKTLQNDPSGDKEVIAMIQLMALEKDQEVENLRAQLAVLVVNTKLTDPSLTGGEREEIIVRATR